MKEAALSDFEMLSVTSSSLQYILLLTFWMKNEYLILKKRGIKTELNLWKKIWCKKKIFFDGCDVKYRFLKCITAGEQQPTEIGWLYNLVVKQRYF